MQRKPTRPVVRHIWDHAVDRFRQRAGATKQTDEEIRTTLRGLAERGVLAEFVNPVHGTLAILNHGFERADYLLSDGWCLVIVDGTLRTVHHNESRRWRPIEH